MARVLLYLFLSAVGAGVTARNGLVPPLGPLPGWASSAIVGAAAGALLAWGVRFAWRELSLRTVREEAAVRVVNAVFVGLATAGVGGLLALALRLALSPSVGVRVAEGLILLLSLLFGLRFGYALERPLLSLSAPSRRKSAPAAVPKVLDTSVIIDGRIGLLLRTGFLEGELLVPEFILAELQGVADSSNSVRRRKGRRGLEVLGELMRDESVRIRLLAVDYPEIAEVDRKLIRLAKEQGACLVTTDYNLNRVAQVEGVRILNVNEVANAVRVPFIPGEELSIEVIDRGEEIGQGVGYLDDGTMVVVENGRRHIGRTIRATVKSTLQTEAGRMLFVEPAGEARWER